MREREAQERVRAVKIELGADVRAVIINRSRVNKKDFADLTAGFFFGDKAQDAALGFS